MHYNLFRDYEPGTGRYIESDPIGLNGGINTYSYAMSNPSIDQDPKGLFYLGGESNNDGNGRVICDHGVLIPVIQVPPPYDQCPIFSICARVHEMSHIQDANLKNPGLCHWYSPLIGQKYLTPSSDVEKKFTELKAYDAEWTCLDDFQRKQKCKNGECNYLISIREEQILNQLIPEVMSGSY